MDYFLKRFKEEIGSMLEPLGFKFKNRCFYIRVTEEKVYQSIELCRYSAPGLRVMARPLFLGKAACLWTDGTWIDKRWPHYRKVEAIQNEIITEMAEIVRDELIPFFEKSKTIEGAYQAEFSGYCMGREGVLAAYKAQEGDCKPLIEYYKQWIEERKDIERMSLASYRENKTMSEDEMKQYSESMEKSRMQAKERIDFYANSSPETIAEHFKAKEEETIEELKLKWKWKF